MNIKRKIEELLIESDISKRTLETYKNWNYKFINFIGKEDLNSIIFKDIVLYIEYLKEETDYSISSKRQAISSLDLIFNKKLKNNYDFKAIKISRPKQETPLTISKKDISSIIKNISNIKHKTAISIIYALGLNPDELTCLLVKDYDSLSNSFIIRRNGEFYRKTTLGQTLIPLLKNYLNNYNPEKYLIENSNTHRKYSKTSLRNTFNKSRDSLNLSKKYTLKNLKYSYAKHLVDEGFQLTDVLNHMKLKNYEVYSRIDGLNSKIEYSPIDSLTNNEKKLNFKVTDEQINNFDFSDKQTIKLLKSKPNLIKSFIENDIKDSDIISIGYRKKQIEKFGKLLKYPDYFNSELIKLKNKSKENLWQQFFEKNKWVFGYGLGYLFLSSLNDKKLEQVVQGHNVNSYGKRVDGLMKTNGIISNMCFIEIKTDNTPLLDNRAYRAGCWAPSKELAGAVAQVQGTVASAVETLSSKISIEDKEGNLTGEDIFNYAPKSYLVIGNLTEFTNENGINKNKYRSFELYRKNTSNPEIITFDELYERAKFIVHNNES